MKSDNDKIKAICEATLQTIEEMRANGTMTNAAFVSIIRSQSEQIRQILDK